MQIYNLSHLEMAVIKSCLKLQTNSLETRNLYSEILYSLIPSNNVQESIKLFGINPDIQDLLVVIVGELTGEVQAFF